MQKADYWEERSKAYEDIATRWRCLSWTSSSSLCVVRPSSPFTDTVIVDRYKPGATTSSDKQVPLLKQSLVSVDFL